MSVAKKLSFLAVSTQNLLKLLRMNGKIVHQFVPHLWLVLIFLFTVPYTVCNCREGRSNVLVDEQTGSDH